MLAVDVKYKKDFVIKVAKSIKKYDAGSAGTLHQQDSGSMESRH